MGRIIVFAGKGVEIPGSVIPGDKNWFPDPEKYPGVSHYISWSYWSALTVCYGDVTAEWNPADFVQEDSNLTVVILSATDTNQPELVTTVVPPEEYEGTCPECSEKVDSICSCCDKCKEQCCPCEFCDYCEDCTYHGNCDCNSCEECGNKATYGDWDCPKQKHCDSCGCDDDCNPDKDPEDFGDEEPSPTPIPLAGNKTPKALGCLSCGSVTNICTQALTRCIFHCSLCYHRKVSSFLSPNPGGNPVLVNGKPIYVTFNPKTQKAIGLGKLYDYYPTKVIKFATLSINPDNESIINPSPVLDSWELKADFARPCPIVPCPGFVDSRKVKSWDEVVKVYEESLAADPKAELILTSFIDAAYSGVGTLGELTIGKGHDGVTAAKGKQVVIPWIPPGFLQDKALLEKAGITNSPHLEFVFNPTSNSVTFTQLRDGPHVKGHCPDYIPREETITKVIVNERGDLLGWAALMKSAGEAPEGVVVWSPEDTLASHYALQAISHGIAFITTKEPVVGQKLIPPVPVSEPNHEQLRQGWEVGAAHLGFTYDQVKKEIAVALALFHLKSALQGTSDWYYGWSIGKLWRLSMVACLGESRYILGYLPKSYMLKFPSSKLANTLRSHLSTGKPSRENCYEQCFSIPTKRLAYQGAKITRRFCQNWWGGGASKIGGQAWGKATAINTGIWNAVVTDNWSEASRMTNIMVNLAHNCGWLLNKFADQSVFNLASQDPGECLLQHVPDLWKLAESRQGCLDEPRPITKGFPLTLPWDGIGMRSWLDTGGEPDNSSSVIHYPKRIWKSLTKWKVNDPAEDKGTCKCGHYYESHTQGDTGPCINPKCKCLGYKAPAYASPVKAVPGLTIGGIAVIAPQKDPKDGHTKCVTCGHPYMQHSGGISGPCMYGLSLCDCKHFEYPPMTEAEKVAWDDYEWMKKNFPNHSTKQNPATCSCGHSGFAHGGVTGKCWKCYKLGLPACSSYKPQAAAGTSPATPSGPPITKDYFSFLSPKDKESLPENYNDSCVFCGHPWLMHTADCSGPCQGPVGSKGCVLGCKGFVKEAKSSPSELSKDLNWTVKYTQAEDTLYYIGDGKSWKYPTNSGPPETTKLTKAECEELITKHSKSWSQAGATWKLLHLSELQEPKQEPKVEQDPVSAAMDALLSLLKEEEALKDV